APRRAGGEGDNRRDDRIGVPSHVASREARRRGGIRFLELTEDVCTQLHEKRGPASCRTVPRPEQAEILQRKGAELFDDVAGNAVDRLSAEPLQEPGQLVVALDREIVDEPSMVQAVVRPFERCEGNPENACGELGGDERELTHAQAVDARGGQDGGRNTEWIDQVDYPGVR